MDESQASSEKKIIGDDWIANIIESSSPLVEAQFQFVKTEEHELIVAAIEAAYNRSSEETKQVRLAAAFDLVIAADYYRHVSHKGWLYCPEASQGPTLFYPYTNVCPSCVLQEQFIFHEANKPSSGRIGSITSHTLALYVQQLLKRKGLEIRVLKGREPVDVIFMDESSTPKTILFAEIKAAPLVTLPLAVASQELTVESEHSSVKAKHGGFDYSNLFGAELSLFVPTRDSESDSWEQRYFPLGSKRNRKDEQWAYRGLVELMKSQEFLDAYFTFWAAAFESYGPRSSIPLFWFTNACGHPSPRPSSWPHRSTGSGYESVSDSKTSVGMDRTDDLKKATYQVLKIGAQGHPSDQFSYRVGILSNIHAVRHFEDYLGALVDIIWTRDKTGKAKIARDLPADAPLFDLFDGIITLTSVIARDEWIDSTFSF